VVAAEAHRIFAPNIWPTEVPALRSAGLAYFEATRAAAHRVTAVCARALGLPADFFEAFTSHSTDTLRMNWYRREEGSPAPLPGQQRMGPHTDYGIVTLLYGDPVAGLEIVGADGEWTGVIPEPGAYVVNIGDLLAQWTNDRWRSTVHRVVPPPADAAGAALRRSIAFFHDGNYDAIVECLPTCCSADDPPRYEPVRALDHLLNKLLGGRTMEPAKGTAHIGDRLDAVQR
jgi:isopenicillin N synthase-like dioxygenase